MDTYFHVDLDILALSVFYPINTPSPMIYNSIGHNSVP